MRARAFNRPSPNLTLHWVVTGWLLSTAFCPDGIAQESPSQNAADAAVPAAAVVAAPKWRKLLPQEPLEGLRFSKHVLAVYPEHTVEVFVYTPEHPGKYPAILDIHGGGWSQRQIESDRPMMERLAKRGFVTALVSYRISSEACYPAALHDCKAAVRYLRAHAEELHINPERIGVMGGSAGGHLSGLTALTSGKREFEGDGPEREVDSAVQACIVMAASQDLVAANVQKTNPGAVAFFGGTCAEKPELYRTASPLTHIRKGVPPTLFIEGEKDSLKIGREEAMEKLAEAGVETGLHTLKFAPHPFWMSDPWCAETVEIAARFFGKHLGGVQPLIPD
jgi:acetyl esterase/lipase